jgi:hypothetical protein
VFYFLKTFLCIFDQQFFLGNVKYIDEQVPPNYVISRTPFSANISVKRSLRKFHDKEFSERKEIDVKVELQTAENVIL